MTVATIDRLGHQSAIFELNVESYLRRAASDKQKERRRQLPTDTPNGERSDNHPPNAATITSADRPRCLSVNRTSCLTLIQL
jgi:hypothetical protein